MNFDLDKVLDGFSIFFSDARQQMLRWFGATADVPEFNGSDLYNSIVYVHREYLNSDCFDLTGHGLSVSSGIITSYPHVLSKNIIDIYAFWHKCLLYREKNKPYTKEERYIALFCLYAFNKFRIEFGGDYAVCVDQKGNYLYTYNDINTVTGSKQDYLSKRCGQLEIKAYQYKADRDSAFLNQNNLNGYDELEAFYKNFTSKPWQITYLQHIDAQYLVSTLKSYSPTKFSLFLNNKNIVPDLQDVDWISKRLRQLSRLYLERNNCVESVLSEEIGTDSLLVSDLLKGKKLKIPLALLVRLDWIFFLTLGDRSRSYELFSMIRN